MRVVPERLSFGRACHWTLIIGAIASAFVAHLLWNGDREYWARICFVSILQLSLGSAATYFVRPTRDLHGVMIWDAVVLSAGCSCLSVQGGLRSSDSLLTEVVLLALVSSACAGGTGVASLLLSRYACRRIRRFPSEAECPACGYDRSGDSSVKCPECGVSSRAARTDAAK